MFDREIIAIIREEETFRALSDCVVDALLVGTRVVSRETWLQRALVESLWQSRNAGGLIPAGN